MGAAAEKVTNDKPRMTGDEVKMVAIGKVKPNDWNPNRMTPFMRQSLKEGLRVDGWLRSHSLLVWRSDENGKIKNIIIDGEHRWEVAKELGFEEAPMVFMHRLTEAAAKSLTVKIDAKRGEFDKKDLAQVIREIQAELGTDVPGLSMSLGIEQQTLMSYLAMAPIDTGSAGEREGVIGPPPGDVGSGMGTHVKMVQLFFSKEQHDEYIGLVKKLAPAFETKNVSDTTLEAMRRVGATKKSSS